MAALEPALADAAAALAGLAAALAEAAAIRGDATTGTAVTDFAAWAAAARPLRPGSTTGQQ